MITKIVIGLVLSITLLLAILIFNTLTFKSKQQIATPASPYSIPKTTLSNFQKAIQIPTVSNEDPLKDQPEQLLAFHQHLSEAYPLCDSLMKKEVINEYSLLYTWEGTNKELPPVVVMGHFDVVPVEEASLHIWKAKPFGGELKDGYIWGRGAIDDKLTVIGLLEGAEKLLNEGVRPQRTIYFAFGHNEEVSGTGAAALAKTLKERGVKPAYVIDEGGLFSEAAIKGQTVALIGICEKGHVTLKLSISMEGGHSAYPQDESAIDVMSNVISRLKKNPFPYKFTPTIEHFCDYIGPENNFLLKMVFANRWLTKNIIMGQFTANPQARAMFHTTTAPTIFKSGMKDNTIPTIAEATVNFRILPGDSIADVVQRAKKIINDDRIQIEVKSPYEASPISNVNGEGFQLISSSMRQIYPDRVVAPFMLIAYTDSRFYSILTPNVYRVLPAHIEGLHSTNERISVEEFEKAMQFYYQLLDNIQKGIEPVQGHP